MSDKRYNEKRLDILSGLVLAANALNGPSMHFFDSNKSANKNILFSD